jgi:hypothetical protein
MAEAGNAEPRTRQCRNDRHGEQESALAMEEQSDLCHREHLLSLKPEVLERFGCLAVQDRRVAFLTAAGRQVSLGDPRSGAV